MVRLNSLSSQSAAPLLNRFSDCSRKTGQNANPLTETGAQIQAEWDEKFGADYRDAVDQLPTAEQAHTPFFEAVTGAYHQAERTSSTIDEIFIPIVSDAMVNTPSVTAYRFDGPTSLFDADVQARLLRDAPDLSKARIVLFLTPAFGTDRQGRGLQSRQDMAVAFLRRYFEQTGADFNIEAL
jgi:hypothetical protein